MEEGMQMDFPKPPKARSPNPRRTGERQRSAPPEELPTLPVGQKELRATKSQTHVSSDSYPASTLAN